MTTNTKSYNNRIVLLHRSGDQKPKISPTETKSKCPQGVLPMGTPRQNLFFASFSLQWLPEFLDLGTDHSRFCLSGDTASWFCATRDKEEYYIMIKGSDQQEAITTINSRRTYIYKANTNRPKGRTRQQNNSIRRI